MAKIPDSLMHELANISAKVIAEYTSPPAMSRVPLDGTDISDIAPQSDPEEISIFQVNRPNRHQSKEFLMRRRDDFDYLFDALFAKNNDTTIGVSRAQMRDALDALARRDARAMDIYVRQEMQTNCTRGYRSWLCFVTARAAYSVKVGQSDILYGLELKK